MTKFTGKLSGSLAFERSGSIPIQLTPGLESLHLTGSLNITGSALTFNGTNVINRIESLEAGGGDIVSLLPLNNFTGSISSEVSTLSSSLNSSISVLNAATSSYLNNSDLSNVVSSSAQIAGLGYIKDISYQEVTGVPSSIISSSAQITALGFDTEAEVPSGTVSSSAQISGLGFITGSTYNNLVGIPSGLLSGSNQIAALGFVTASVSDNSALNTFTSSIQSEVNAIKAQTGSYLTSLPSGLLSGSTQITDLGYITSASAASLGFGSGGASISSGTVSSSLQITSLGFITGSIYSDLVDIPSGIISSSEQVTSIVTDSYISASVAGSGFGSGGASIPAGTVSSSAQITSAITSGDLDMGGNKVLFGNVYSQLSDLPNASSYHGMFAHVHATGKAYYAHGGNWIELANDSQIDTLSTSISDLESELNVITAATGSYLTSVDYGDVLNVPSGIVSSSAQISALGFGGGGASIPSGTVSSSTQIEAFGFITSSDVAYDGNRVISNTDHPLFNTFNPGSEGTITDFLDAMFYPNSAPSITTGNQTIAEFTPSGSSIVTLAGSDAESQAITFSIDGSYTDDYVVVESGVLKLKRLPTVEDFNTDDRGDGTLSHPVVIKATDTVGGSSTKTIYIDVTSNTAPIFRETSISGNQITSFSTSRNESAAAGLVSRVYFTDAESDSITITSASDATGHFSLTKYATYVELRQVTSSLDYESITSYSMSITASDEHAIAGDDINSVSTLPISISVVDNVQPTVNDQTLTGVNENSSDGDTAGSISATDSEGNTITFASARLHSLELDGTSVATGSYSGTSQATDPHEDAFSIASNGVVTRKSGIYLNSDLINKYIYEVRVTDAYNTGTDTGLISIPIADDAAPTLSGDTTLYVIESAEDGDNIYDNSNGYSGTVSIFSANQSVNWTVSSSNDFTINSSGYLFAGRDISGSATVGGSQIDGIVTATNAFGSFSTQAFSVNVTDNQAPNITFSNTSANLNTNKARANSNNLVTISFSDPEGNTIDHDSFSATFAGANLNAVKSGDSYLIRATDTLVAGGYEITASISDAQGFATRTSTHDFTIAQAVVGSLSVNGTLYIIESADSGDSIVLGTSGRSGTQGDLSVSYSPSYGSQAVQAFTSSNALIAVNSNGNLTVGNNISGSGNVGGSTLSSTINFQDQYGNIGSGSITVNITDNAAPTISFSDTSGNHNTNLARPGNTLTTVSFSDNEGDGINYDSFTLTDASGNLNAVKSGDNYLIQPNTNLSASTYTYSISITDEHGFATSTESDSFTVAQADSGTLNGDTTIYVIESAESGDVFRDATGYNNGNAADVGVSYSTSYGSPSVTEFTSSRQGISVNSSGNLTAGYNFSGSVTSTDYTSTTLVSDSTNSTLYGKSLHVNGIKVVQGAATGSQSAVPDAFTEKVAQTIKLMVTSSGADINDTDQANMIGILKGETGTWHSGYPTTQRILRGAGSDYSPNPLIDSNYSSYPGLQNFQDSNATDDMIWYLNSSAASGSGDADIVEVIEHIFHTIHQYGVRGAVSGSFYGLSWDPETDSDWNTRELYYAIKEAVDESVFDITDYGDASYNTASTFKLIAKEYLYLLNFNMWEYSSLWSGGSLDPEWADQARTPSGIDANNPLGYALYNDYIKPVLTKPSKTVLENIFQDGDVGDPTVAGSSGYTPEASTGNDWSDRRSLLGGERRILFNKSTNSKPTIIKNVPSGFFQSGVKITTK